MQVSAILRYARISPQKCRLVADLVRGQPVGDGARDARVHAEEGREARAQGARVGDRERRATTTTRTSTTLKVALHRGRRGAGGSSASHARAKGRGNAHRQAQQPHQDHRRRQATVRREQAHMGQKVNPIGIRLGITRDWTSRWYADTEDFPAYILLRLAGARVPAAEARRKPRSAASTSSAPRARPTSRSTPARPGVVIGKKGEDIESCASRSRKLMRMAVQRRAAQHRRRSASPSSTRQLVAEGIAQQIEKRVMFRRAMKRAVTNTMRSGALGVKVRDRRPPERRRDRAHGVDPRGPHPAAHVPRRHRLRHRPRRRRPTASSASRSGSSRARCSTARPEAEVRRGRGRDGRPRRLPKPRRPRRLSRRPAELKDSTT